MVIFVSSTLTQQEENYQNKVAGRGQENQEGSETGMAGCEDPL